MAQSQSRALATVTRRIPPHRSCRSSPRTVRFGTVRYGFKKYRQWRVGKTKFGNKSGTVSRPSQAELPANAQHCFHLYSTLKKHGARCGYCIISVATGIHRRWWGSRRRRAKQTNRPSKTPRLESYRPHRPIESPERLLPPHSLHACKRLCGPARGGGRALRGRCPVGDSERHWRLGIAAGATSFGQPIDALCGTHDL